MSLIQIAPHPLHGRSVCGIDSWDDWLVQWNKAETAEELVSLLHYSASIDMRRETDPHIRTHFWLAVANGYNLDSARCYSGELYTQRAEIHERLFGQDDATYRTTLKEDYLTASYYGGTFLKVAVAKKAWQLLCTNIFDRNYYWSRAPGLFTAILEFFDPSERWYNLPSEQTKYRDERSHQTARNFLRKFVKSAWRMSKDPSLRTVEERSEEALLHKEMMQARPKLMGMLAIMGEYELMRELLSNASVRVLQLVSGLALAHHEEGCPLITKERYASLEEAVAHESPLAELLLLHHTRRAEFSLT